MLHGELSLYFPGHVYTVLNANVNPSPAECDNRQEVP